MSKSLKPRRGTTAQHASFIGEAHEVTYDTDKQTLVTHDGLTAGGFPLAHEADVAGKVSSLDSTLRALIAEEVAKLLPLAGGTMTAGIIFAVNNGLNVITADNANSYLQVCGGTTYANGATAAFHGIGSSGKGGWFELRASNNAEGVSLRGTPGGGLTWGGANIVRAVNDAVADASGKVTIDIPVSSVDGATGAVSTASEKGSNYIRFSSGLQICWATVSIAQNSTAATWSFPKAFSSAPRCTATVIGTASAAISERNYEWYDNSASSIKIKADSQSGTGLHCIAIGLWK